MMERTTATVSDESPAPLDLATVGETGPGTPTWATQRVELGRAAGLAARGEWRRAAHRAESVLANVWNFQLRPGREAAECPCCGWRGPAFLSFSNWRAVQHNSGCPACGSRSRHRGLTLLLPDLLRDKPGGPSLIFAPERALIGLLDRLLGESMMTTDYLRTDVHYPGEDIQQLSFADNRFAFLMCNHVLEHIPDDAAALCQCARVLRPGGLAVFTMPGDYHRQPTRVLDKPDANGHLRHYGLDVVEKIRAAGFGTVTPTDMSVGRPARYHIHPGDMAFVCRK
jgi:hypothetical protein